MRRRYKRAARNGPRCGNLQRKASFFPAQHVFLISDGDSDRSQSPAREAWRRWRPLITLLNEAAHRERNNLLEILEERFARRLAETEKQLDHRITGEVARLDHRITEEIAKLEQRITGVEAKLEQRITEEAAKLEARMAGMRADLIRWMFLFWVGQIGTLIALFYAFLR